MARLIRRALDTTRRLDRGGDRQADAAPHRIVQTRSRVDPRTREATPGEGAGGAPPVPLGRSRIPSWPSRQCCGEALGPELYEAVLAARRAEAELFAMFTAADVIEAVRRRY